MAHRRTITASALALTAAAVLVGCSFSASPVAVLDRDRAAGDELHVLEDHAYESVDEPTSRYIGDHEGTDLWLARGTDSGSVCLIVVTAEEDWITGCGGLPTRLGGVGGTFEVRADGALPPEGMTRISENIFVA